MFRLCLAAAAFAVLCAAAPASGADSKARQQAAAGPTRFYFFNLRAGDLYEIAKNDVAAASVRASNAGVLTFNDVTESGDVYRFTPSGFEPNPPSPPTNVLATGGNDGCARLTWQKSPNLDVTGYTIYYGRESLVTGTPEDSLGVGDVSSASVCGLAGGVYYFALRATNGTLGALSNESSTTVTNGNTQAPLPPQSVQASETSPGCVTVSWRPNSEPDLAGYVVYYGPASVAQGQASSYADSADVGTDTLYTACGFDPGTQFFAVRAYNDTPEYSGYSTERSVDVEGVDVTAPVLTGASPIDGQFDVSRDAMIFFILRDTQAGVDTNSVNVTVTGVSLKEIKFFGDPSNYAVLCELDGLLPALSQIDVSVSASDHAPTANTMNESWSFTTSDTIDTSAPTFCCESPANGATGVDIHSPISVGISDIGSGVDLANLVFEVNGTAVPYAVTGDPVDAVVTYQNTGGFKAGGVVNVRIVACDLSGGKNCATLDNYSFSVIESPVATGAPAAEIHPNGYWADDPNRPLEVLNIPRGWTVRIFDTAGFEVRSYRNDSGSSLDWTWDFENAHGRRVARSLYLVRVVDDAGSVQQAGRFLVQRD